MKNKNISLARQGDPFGVHRVLEPKGVLPQAARVVDNNMAVVYDNEIRVNVEALNVDSASFTQIRRQAGDDIDKIKAIILGIVRECGKLKNPVTGSGGILIGTVDFVGSVLQKNKNIKVGDKIASLVSLSLTPLRIDKITEVCLEIDRVLIEGHAILFESGIFSVLPPDMPEKLALSVLDVCGAPAQTARLVRSGDTVAIIGACGKSGVLCAYEARRRAGVNGRIIGIEWNAGLFDKIKMMGYYDELLRLDATDALACYEAIRKITNGAFCDVVINNVNIPDTEMASILICKERGKIYFFSMATSFTKAALGAEGVGKDVDIMIGNGYARGHDLIALDIIRQSAPIRALYDQIYS